MASRIKQLAQYALNRVVPTLSPKLTVNSVDYSSALMALAMTAAKGSENLTDGRHSLTGHHMSLQRVGSAMSAIGIKEMEFERVGQMEWFGSRKAVYAPKDRTILLDPQHEMLEWGKTLFAQSERCRPEEYSHLINTTRGFFELFNLGFTLQNTFDAKQGQFFPTRGNKYLKQLVGLYEKDENLAAFRLLSDFDRAGLLY